jgi:hypothetical protein
MRTLDNYCLSTSIFMTFTSVTTILGKTMSIFSSTLFSVLRDSRNVEFCVKFLSRVRFLLQVHFPMLNIQSCGVWKRKPQSKEIPRESPGPRVSSAVLRQKVASHNVYVT